MCCWAEAATSLPLALTGLLWVAAVCLPCMAQLNNSAWWCQQQQLLLRPDPDVITILPHCCTLPPPLPLLQKLDLAAAGRDLPSAVAWLVVADTVGALLDRDASGGAGGGLWKLNYLT